MKEKESMSKRGGLGEKGSRGRGALLCRKKKEGERRREEEKEEEENKEEKRRRKRRRNTDGEKGEREFLVACSVSGLVFIKKKGLVGI